MQLDEVQAFLDGMLMPFQSNYGSIKADGSLTLAEKNVLYQIVLDFELQDEKYDYRSALKAIAGIMERYVRQASEVQGVPRRIPVRPDAVPFLLKQAPFPEDLTVLGEDGIRQVWHDARLRGRGYSRAAEIIQYATASVGIKDGAAAAVPEAGHKNTGWHHI